MNIAEEPCTAIAADLPTTPALPRLRWAMGETLIQRKRARAHGYTLVGVAPHVTAKGAPSAILTWAGRCAACGAPFDVTSGRSACRGQLCRTCPEHRPGRPAVPAGGVR